MLKQDYQAWMDQVEPGQDFQARLTEAMAAQPVRRPRRIGRTMLAAAAVCGVLMVSAFALSPTLRQMLESALGGYTEYARPVEGADVSNGMELRVVSALNSGSIFKVYAELRNLDGEPVCDTLRVSGILTPLEGGEDTGSITSSAEWVGYEKESETALLEFTVWGFSTPIGDQLELSAIVLPPLGELEITDQWKIAFTAEELPVRRIPLNGEISGTPLLQAELSALGVTIQTDGWNTIDAFPLTVFCKDGRRLSLTHGGGGSVGDTRLTCWEYDEPVEPEKVTGLALGQWYIPLEGEKAGQSYWLEEQP
ncbi:hypothetical protein [Flavonifractor sp. AGMB03687]|uniref:hypothetical protein n=1 Tax=Flavonifractor sp. AGMB03687 TaxID=2785133 RepID=UPI001ADF321C|nr:hypothetical protein [Flavonifractor sp. AGMB03687]